MSVWFDRDDPRNNDDDGYEEPLCPDCGGPCRCSKNNPSWERLVQESRDYLKSLPPEFGPLDPVECAACGDTGFLSFTSQPYGRGWGHVTETIPCACRTKR